jgi:hypothetical protein
LSVLTAAKKIKNGSFFLYYRVILFYDFPILRSIVTRALAAGGALGALHLAVLRRSLATAKNEELQESKR